MSAKLEFSVARVVLRPKVKNIEEFVSTCCPLYKADIFLLNNRPNSLIFCDQVSAFTGKEKQTAGDKLIFSQNVIETFKKLSNMPTEFDIETSMCDLQQFVVLMYDRASTCGTTNEGGRRLFTTKSCSIDNILLLMPIPETITIVAIADRLGIEQGSISYFGLVAILIDTNAGIQIVSRTSEV